MSDENVSKKSGFFKSLFGKICLSITVFLVVCLGLIWWLEARKYVWTNDANIEAYTVSLSADVEARLTQLYVDEGYFVKTGDLICDLDRSILESEKIEAETNVELLTQMKKEKKILMEKLRDDYIVAKNEFESDIISPLEYDHKEKDFRLSEQEYVTAQAQLENGEAELGVIVEKIAHTQVWAPMEGMIAKRWVYCGDVVEFGQPLFELNDLKDVWITANLEETKLEHVKIGSPVKIHVDAYPGKEFTGHVFVIKGSAASKFALIPPDNATGNFTKVVQRIPVKIHIDVPKNEELYLFPGMSCEVKIYIR